jgi:hypothetical protein
MKRGGKERYGRRAGDLAGGRSQALLVIKTRGVGTHVVGYAHGTTLEEIGRLVREGFERGLTLKLDDEQHIILPAQMVRDSVFIVKAE